MSKSTVKPPPARPAAEEQAIPASSFTRYPYNRVPKGEAVAEMAGSIREVGQLQPITCRRGILEDGRDGYEIIFGETRWLGCRKIHPDFPVRAYVIDLDDKEAAKIHAVENFQRSELDEIEEAQAIKHMLDQGWEIIEIMNHLGRAKTFVYQRLTILKLDGEAQQAIREGNLALDAAEVIAALPEERRGEALKACIEPKYKDRALSRREALDLLQRDFVTPLKKAAEWEESRGRLEKENPGARCLPYEEARGYRQKNWNACAPAGDAIPPDCLTEAALKDFGEANLPSWGDLARKNQVEMLICLPNHGDGAVVLVDTNAVILADRAANGDGSIFIDPAVVVEGEEKEKAEEKAKREKRAVLIEAGDVEKSRMIDLIFGGKVPAGAARKLAAVAILREQGYCGFENIDLVFSGGAEIEDSEERDAYYEKRMSDHFKVKDLNAFELLGRLWLALKIAEADHDFGFVFEAGAFKRAQFPALSELHPASE